MKIITFLSGEHNALNITACYAFCRLAGISDAGFKKAIASFHGIKKRCEIIGRAGGNVFIEDFAHHPTEISLTEKSVKESNPGSRLISIFQPSSASSNTSVFYGDYLKSFESADILIVTQRTRPDRKTGRDFDSEKFVADIKRSGKQAYYIENAKDLAKFVLDKIRKHDVVITHSSSDFGCVIRDIYRSIRMSLRGA